MKTFELTPIDGRKSFYGKARVIDDGKIAKLLSYDTIVAEYNRTTKEMKINGEYSDTTRRHINAFLSYYGFDTVNKKQLNEFYL